MCAQYDASTSILVISYRSGRKRIWTRIVPSQVLALISVVGVKSLMICCFLCLELGGSAS